MYNRGRLFQMFQVNFGSDLVHNLTGMLFQIYVGLGLVYNLRQHSGLIFQVYYKKQHKKQKTREFSEVIASGGRYDKLVGSGVTA